MPFQGSLCGEEKPGFFKKPGFLMAGVSEGEGGFPCLYWLSALIGVAIALPSTALMLVRVLDAGDEILLRYAWTLGGGGEGPVDSLWGGLRVLPPAHRPDFPEAGAMDGTGRAVRGMSS